MFSALLKLGITSLLATSLGISAAIATPAITGFYEPKPSDPNFRVAHDYQGRIMLVSKTCDSIKQEIEALKEWKKLSEGQHIIVLAPNTSYTRNGLCYTDITTLLPRRVEQAYYRQISHHGPNCWNASLQSLGYTKYTRTSALQEFQTWMNDSPYCRKLEASEELQAGDIGAVRYGFKQGSVWKPRHEFHSFTYISPKLIYHKLNWSTKSRHQLRRTADFFESKEVKVLNKKCLRGNYNGKCVRWVDHFRCEYIKNEDSFAEQFSDQTQYHQLAKKIEVIEEEISSILSYAPITQVTSLKSQTTVLSYLGTTANNNKPKVIIQKKKWQPELKDGTAGDIISERRPYYYKAIQGLLTEVEEAYPQNYNEAFVRAALLGKLRSLENQISPVPTWMVD